LTSEISASLRRSLDAMDNEELRVASTPGAWVSAVVFIGILLALEAHPRTGAWLDFDPGRVVGALGVCLVFVGHLWVVRRRDGARFSMWQGFALLLENTGTQFLAATLYLGTQAPAAPIFALLFLMTCLANGGQTRAGLRRPLMAAATIVALAAGYLWTSAEVPWGELVVVGAAGLMLELVAGEMAYSKQRAVDEAARLRAVVHAQLLQHQEQDAARLNDAIGDAVQNGRMLREIVSEAVAVGDLLQGLSPQLGPRPGSLILRMQGLMGRLDSLVHERLGKQPTSYSEREAVPLSPLLGLVIDSIRFRFPHLVVEIRGSLPDHVQAMILGGPVGCRRILESVLLNACEGDGNSAARRVVVTPTISPYSGQVTLEFVDDGPGFPPHVLEAPVEGLLTTKEGRQNGLGLYSAASVLTASGGGLERENAEPSGARVLLRIPAQQPPEEGRPPSEVASGRGGGSRFASG
jgi:two-component system C4-dicarboxylate transport sensor histidine kinase DctB